MDILGNVLLGFFATILFPLFLPFLLMAALAAMAGQRPERALQMGFDLLETFVTGGLKLIWLAAKTIYRLSLKKPTDSGGTKKGDSKKPIIVVCDPD